ncbi:hypothetical protein KEM54_000782, partial [Ascosphaera aggregata]
MAKGMMKVDSHATDSVTKVIKWLDGDSRINKNNHHQDDQDYDYVEDRRTADDDIKKYRHGAAA